MAYNDTNGGSTANGDRDERGRLLPGHRSPGPGRPTRAVEKQYLDAIRQSLPPDQVETIITEAIELARQTRSWRGLLEVVQFAVAYGAGKPMQKIVTADSNLDMLLAALQDDSPLPPTAAPSPAQP